MLLFAFRGGIPEPSFWQSFWAGPLGGVPSWSIQHLVHTAFHPWGIGGPCDLFPWCIWSYLFALQTPTDGSGLMQLLIYTAAPVHHGKITWDPPRVEQTDRQTCVKTLPSRTLRIRAVMNNFMTGFRRMVQDWCACLYLCVFRHESQNLPESQRSHVQHQKHRPEWCGYDPSRQ